jgi:diguanylate cyclase (GGDEF)-like protein
MTRPLPHGRALGYSVALGVLGWGALIAASWIPHLAPAPPPSNSAWTFALFLAVILAGRLLAFHPVPERVIALDTAYFVAAGVCLGSVPAGQLVALALTGDSLLRLVLAARRGRMANESWADALGYAFYFGGMTGALVMACAQLFGVDRLDLGQLAPGAIALIVGGLGVALLVTHYALQGARAVLMGRSLRSYARELALPGMLSEASLLPLGAVLVLIYRPDSLLGVALLSGIYVVISYLFNRLSRTGAALRRRVGELEILNQTARRLAASLQLEELVETVERETTRAIPEAEVLALVHRGTQRDDGRHVVDCFDRERDQFSRVYVGKGEGATGWVMAHQAPLTIPDLADSDIDPGPAGHEGVRSWLGVPIFMYGGVEGVLAIQSRTADVFGAEHRRLLESISLQVAAALQNAHLYEMAMVDGLTGLFVRRYFDARIEEEIERSKRYGQAFSVVMMDIDDFKHLNDTHGHLVGDRVLRGVAQVVKTQMRGVDTAARYGGEEISIVLPRTEMVAALNQAERIRAAIADLRVTAEGAVGPAIGVTASFGIAAYPESGAVTAEDLVRKADRALYRAKKTGKNRVELFWADESGPMPAIPVQALQR